MRFWIIICLAIFVSTGNITRTTAQDLPKSYRIHGPTGENIGRAEQNGNTTRFYSPDGRYQGRIESRTPSREPGTLPGKHNKTPSSSILPGVRRSNHKIVTNPGTNPGNRPVAGNPTTKAELQEFAALAEAERLRGCGCGCKECSKRKCARKGEKCCKECKCEKRKTEPPKPDRKDKELSEKIKKLQKQQNLRRRAEQQRKLIEGTYTTGNTR